MDGRVGKEGGREGGREGARHLNIQGADNGIGLRVLVLRFACLLVVPQGLYGKGDFVTWEGREGGRAGGGEGERGQNDGEEKGREGGRTREREEGMGEGKQRRWLRLMPSSGCRVAWRRKEKEKRREGGREGGREGRTELEGLLVLL
jgi:hypothetical protein